MEENHIDQSSMGNMLEKAPTKIVFFHISTADNFLKNIIQWFDSNKLYEVKKIEVTTSQQIDEGMKWADICWFEWCDSLVLYGSNHNLARDKKIVCRLHSYEAFTEVPLKVNWDNVDKLIFVANHIRDQVLKKINIDNKKVEVIPNGLDLNTLTFAERTKGYNIAYVGYIDYKKGPMLLLHTFKGIHDIDNKYKLFIAGKFTDERYILYFNHIIKEFKLQDAVFFQGWQDNLDSWLEDKDYILCTSVLESQNVSIMQAMSKGIKPIIHNFVGAKDLYPLEYIWNTIYEAVNLIKEDSYTSMKYRKFIEENYSFEKEIFRISMVVDILKKTLIKEKLYENTISSQHQTNNVKEDIQEIINASKDKNPLVTVGIANYNYGHFLSECIESVLNQSYGNIEILIIDDCSSDNSKEIIENYEKVDSRIKAIYHEKNSGSLIQAFNEVIECSSGEYFTLISADDYLADKNAIEKVVRIALSDEELDQIYTNITTVDEEGITLEQWKYKDYTDEEVIMKTFLMKGSGIIPYTSSLFKKEFFIKNNIRWQEADGNILGLDTLNTLINIKFKCKRKYLDESLMCYRQHGNNMTYNFKNRVISIISILEYIINNFSEEIYLNSIEWNSMVDSEREGVKAYILGVNYYNIMADYFNGINMPWSKEITFDKEQIIEYIQPFIPLISKYLMKSLNLTKRYEKEISKVIENINKLKDTKVNLKEENEEGLQGQIFNEGMRRKQQELQKFKGKYYNKKINILILSPSNGFWKYAFTNWKAILEFMGCKVNIINSLSSQETHEGYDVLISLADIYHMNLIEKNISLMKISNKVGIAEKSQEDILGNIENIKMCKRINFKFLISSFCEEVLQEHWINWLENEISIVSVPFGFNPLIHYPENTLKKYDYFYVGTNSPLKGKETRDYLLNIVNKYPGILRGVGWGENISDLRESNVGYFYNRANINLNYHLWIQREECNEVNERMFVIGACGGFQLTDYPKAISKYYTEKDMAIAKTPKEYIEMYEYYINKPRERYEKAYNALIRTYEGKNSLFYRMDKILKELGYS